MIASTLNYICSSFRWFVLFGLCRRSRKHAKMWINARFVGHQQMIDFHLEVNTNTVDGFG